MNPRISIPYFEFFRRVPVSVMLTVASFFLYLYTLAPDVVDADGGEFQFAAWNFAFVHPTGYPLFLIVGGIFQHLFPAGNPAFRLNVFTAITAAFAVGAFYFAAHEITHDKISAAIAAVAFAFSRTFWFDAGAAETYDLNASFLAALIFFAVRWKSNPSSRTFALFCLTYGLAFTHHRTIMLWLPVFALYFLLTTLRILKSGVRVQFSVSRFALYALCFTLPLLFYLYIPLRAPASPYYQIPIVGSYSIVNYDNSLTGFINYFLGRVFESELKWDALSMARVASTPQLLLDQFGALGVALGVLGFIAMLWRRERLTLALLVLGFLATIFFAAVYHIGDIFHYYIPAYLVWALLISNCKFLISKFKAPIANHQLPITVMIGVLLVGLQFSSNLQFADRSHETPRDQWTKILSMPIPPNAILISNDRDEMMPFWYIQYVERTRTDIAGLFPLITPEPKYANVGRVTDAVLDAGVGRPIYFIKPMPGMEIKYRLDASSAPLVRVLGRAAENPPQHTSNAAIAERMRVLGYDLERVGNNLRVSVYFQPTAKLDRNYTAYVNLFSPRGGKMAQGDDHQVGGNFYPTTLWQPGEILRDTQTISLADVRPDTYRLFVGMYAQPGLNPFGEPAEIGIVEVQ